MRGHIEDRSQNSSFDIIAEDIAKSLHVVFMKYSGNYDWVPGFEVATLWDNLKPEVKAMLIAVVKKLLLLGKIDAGPNTRMTAESP